MTKKQHPADQLTEQYRALEHNKASRAKASHIALLLTCTSILVGFGAVLCLGPKESFSPTENRTLTTKPTVSLEALTDGTLTRSLSDFCADQFPARSSFVSAKAATELLLGRQQNNDVLIGSDGYLIKRQEYTEENRQTMEQNLVYAARFAKAMDEQNIPLAMAVIPRSVDVNTQHLPALYDTSASDAAWSWLKDACEANSLTVQDLTEPLKSAAQADERVWFKTDHHWTVRGAYHAYVALADTLGYVPYPYTDFTEQTVTESFLGTTYSSSGMYWTDGEHLTLARYEGDEQLVTEIIEGGRVTKTIEGLYDLDAVRTHDEYNVFLGGTNTHIRVTDSTDQEKPTLILLKDSFAQSLAPYLARHYQLVLLDPRTYKTANGSIAELIASYQPDRVLLLYGIDTLCDSTSLKMLTFGLK